MSITRDEEWKIRNLLSTIESMDGVLIPFPVGRKLSDVHRELKNFLECEEVVG